MGIWLVFQQGFYWTLRRERVKRLLWQTWCWTSTRVALRKSTFFHQPSSLMTTGLDGCEKIHWQRNGHQTHWWKPHLLWHLWGEGLEERNRHAGRNNKVYDSLCWIHVFLHQKNDSYHKMWGGSCIFPFQPNPMFNENTSKLHQILTSKVQFHEFSIKFPTQAAKAPTSKSSSGGRMVVRKWKEPSICPKPDPGDEALDHWDHWIIHSKGKIVSLWKNTLW